MVQQRAWHFTCVYLPFLTPEKKRKEKKKSYYKVHMAEKYKFNIKRIIAIEMSIQSNYTSGAVM